MMGLAIFSVAFTGAWAAALVGWSRRRCEAQGHERRRPPIHAESSALRRELESQRTADDPRIADNEGYRNRP